MARMNYSQLYIFPCFVTILAVLICGCGGGRRQPAKSGAARYLNQAKSYEEQAVGHKDKGEDAEALMCFKMALEKIDTGLKKAFASERPAFRTVRERIEPMITELEMKAKAKLQREAAARKEAEEKKKAEKYKKAEVKNDEDAKRKAEEEAKKKEAEARVALLKKQQEETSVKATKVVAGGDDDDEDAAAKLEEATKKKDEKPKPPPGPFKTYAEGQKPPRLSVDKVVRKGDYIYAYIQIYNDKDQNMRIARPDVTFTTHSDADLCPADAHFDYKVFDKTANDPFEQSNPRASITGGSHEVFGNCSFKMLSIAQNKEKASRARKAKVTIIFDDGSTWTVRGPLDAKAPVVEGLPGL
jgi:hypothetical protein